MSENTEKVVFPVSQPYSRPVQYYQSSCGRQRLAERIIFARPTRYRSWTPNKKDLVTLVDLGICRYVEDKDQHGDYPGAS